MRVFMKFLWLLPITGIFLLIKFIYNHYELIDNNELDEDNDDEYQNIYDEHENDEDDE